MRRPRISGQLLLASAYLTSAFSIPDVLLERQAATCAAGTNFTQCADSGLPAGFCCRQDTDCVTLAGNTTVLCCPTGQNCQTIKPITCDIQQQNATAHPDSTLKTTALTGTLDFCGVSCCPFGYSCNSDGNCAQNSDQSKAPPTSATSSTASSSSTASPTSTPTSSTSNSTITTSPAAEKSDSKPFPTGPVVGGIFGGLAVGVGITVALIWLCGARRRKAERRKSGSSFGNISDPQPIHHVRTDFLRKSPNSPSTTSTMPQRSNTITRVRSLFRKSGASTGNGTPNFQHTSPRAPPPIPMIPQSNSPQELPVTPMQQREPSYVDIDIFADGDTASDLRQRERMDYQSGVPSIVEMGGRPYSADTTFSDMMKQSGLAGLQKGQPYIYRPNSPAYPPSPSR